MRVAHGHPAALTGRASPSPARSSAPSAPPTKIAPSSRRSITGGWGFASTPLGCKTRVRPVAFPPPSQARQEADAADRQSLRDDGLGSAEKPGGLRATGPLRRRSGLDAG